MKTIGKMMVAVALAAASSFAGDVDSALARVRGVNLGKGYFTTVEYHPAAEIGTDWRPHPAAGMTEVAWVLKPVPDSFIRCIVFLPPDGKWDGRMLGVGSGGPAGTIPREGLAKLARERGCAVAYTDLGTADREMHRPGRVEDFGNRATHLMTVSAKEVIRAFYGRGPHRSYFQGESTGGNQAFQELLRYPGDYDGIIAGVPAFDRMGVHVYFQWNWRQLHDDGGKSVFAPSELAAVTNAAAAYFREKGLKGVERRYTGEACGTIVDAAVRFAPSLDTADKKSRLKRMFTGPVVNGRNVFPGVPLGAPLPDSGGNWWLLKWRLGEDRRLQTVTDDELEAWMKDWGPACDAVSTDMSAFAGHGGKLIAYAGELDACIPWEPLIDWHLKANCPESRAVYLLPERTHGGPPEITGMYRMLVDWVENGVRPGRVDVAMPDKTVRKLDPVPAVRPTE